MKLGAPSLTPLNLSPALASAGSPVTSSKNHEANFFLRISLNNKENYAIKKESFAGSNPIYSTEPAASLPHHQARPARRRYVAAILGFCRVKRLLRDLHHPAAPPGERTSRGSAGHVSHVNAVIDSAFSG
jgi:hypothetical protein